LGSSSVFSSIAELRGAATPSCARSEIECSAARAVDGTPAWLFDGSTFYLHDGSFSLRVVDRLKATPTIRLSPPEIPQFLERAHGLLDRQTAAARRAGLPIKVALIAGPTDLGTVHLPNRVGEYQGIAALGGRGFAAIRGCTGWTVRRLSSSTQ